MSLVLVVEMVAKGRSLRIEDADQVFRVPFSQAVHVVGKAEDGVGRLPGRPGHHRYRMEDLVKQGVGIDEVDHVTQLLLHYESYLGLVTFAGGDLTCAKCFE